MDRGFFVPELSTLNFPNGLDEVRADARGRKRLLRVLFILWLVLAAVPVRLMFPPLADVVRRGLMGVAVLQFVCSALAALCMIAVLLALPSPIAYLKYVWGGRDSWKRVYQWSDDEKKLKRSRQVEARLIIATGLSLFILFLLWSAALAPLASIFPAYYSEFNRVVAYRSPDFQDWRVYMVWQEERGVFIASDAEREGHYYHWGNFPETLVRTEVLRRGHVADYNPFPVNRTMIERYLEENPDRPLFDEGAEWKYRYSSRDLETGRYESPELSEAELAAMGVNTQYFESLLPPVVEEPRRGRR